MLLRPYQEKLILDIRQCFARGQKNVLAVSPTGSGKTATTAGMISRAVSRGHRCMFTVHRQELMDQSIEAFKEQGIDHGCIAAGYEPDYSKPVQIASIDTLRKRLDVLEAPPSLLIVDEAAHSCSKTWRSVISHFDKSFVVGLTATPERLDGKGLGDIFGAMVMGPTTRWLIDHGFLSDYDLFGPSVPDLSGVKTRAGDFVTDQIASIMDTPRITGDAINEYIRHCSGKRAIAFCAGIAHSEHTAAAFRDRGYSAVHVDGNTPKQLRREIMADFRSGKIKVVTNVDLFGEGVDVPSVECVIGLRPTQSLSLYIQQVGRVLRKSDGKDRAIILDHAGNWKRHLLPDEDREWSLDGRKKKTKTQIEDEVKTKIRQCPVCYLSHRPAPICPYCKFQYPIKAREIEQVDGVLDKISRDQAKAVDRRKRGYEEFKSETREDLEKLAFDRGYKSPTVWAELRLAAREERKPDFKIAMARRVRYA